MSQEETLKAVTSEWSTTAEIAGRAPRRGVHPLSHRNNVHADLQRLCEKGLVERRDIPPSGWGARVAWRLAQ